MMKKLIVLGFVGACFFSYGQQPAQQPKLVVGIVVDQMRREYLDRYKSKFGDDGFNRMLREGFDLRNAHYNYMPTLTGPGHASIFTGTTPGLHGIIGNDWYDKNAKDFVNCVSDTAHIAVGIPSAKGQVSPWRMQSTTITDELKMSTQKRARVIGISLKDRGAVLPAGHMGDGAYWFDAASGTFITSTFYGTSLPSWLDAFNQKGLPAKYMDQVWDVSYPIDQYTESGADDRPYEARIAGKPKPVFPYDLKTLKGRVQGYGILSYTPFGNDLLTELAGSAIDGEKLGADAITDFLTISYSATDGLGHAVGPRAVEIEDMYIRLDRNLATLLNLLDQRIGKGNYLVFLTSDHGVAEVAQELIDQKVPAGYLNEGKLKDDLNNHLKSYLSKSDLVEVISNHQVFFNHESFDKNPRSSGVEMIIAAELTHRYLMGIDGIAQVFTESVLRQGDFGEEGVKGMVIRGFHPRRSGDVAFALEPGWYAGSSTQGSTHGSTYPYDTHVPVLFFGAGIRSGSSVKYYSITDIAPTLSMLLNITLPSASTGQPVAELFE